MFCIESFPHNVQKVKKPLLEEARSPSTVDIKMADVTVQLCPETLLKLEPPSYVAYDDGVVCAVGRKNSAVTFESDKTVSRQHCTIRLIVSPNYPLLASLSTSTSDVVNKHWFVPRTKEENDACAEEGVDLVVTDMGSKYGTFIMKQQKNLAAMGKTEVDNNDTDTDNEAEAPMSLCFNANKATRDEKSAEIEQVNLVQHSKLTPNKPYPLRLSSNNNNDAIVWIQCGVSGSLVRITRSLTANNSRNSMGNNNDIDALSNEVKDTCMGDKGEVPIRTLRSNEISAEDHHDTTIETQQTFTHRPTKRSKTNTNIESQWQSRITSHQKDRQIIRSDDNNQNHENSGTERVISPTSAITTTTINEISHLEARNKKLPSPTKDGWLVIAPSKDRSAYRRVDVAQLLIEEGGMEEALTECRTDLIVIHEKNKSLNNRLQKSNQPRVNNIFDFKKFHKNFVLKGLDDEKNITLTAVLPKETDRQNHKELTQQQIEEDELFVDALFNPKGPRNVNEVLNKRRARG